MFQRARGVSPAREREKKLNLQRAGSAEPLLSLTYAPGQPGVAMLPFPSLKGKSEMLYDICQGGSLVTGGHILPRICMTLGRRKGGPQKFLQDGNSVLIRRRRPLISYSKTLAHRVIRPLVFGGPGGEIRTPVLFVGCGWGLRAVRLRSVFLSGRCFVSSLRPSKVQ